jgi:hypothetical protein
MSNQPTSAQPPSSLPFLLLIVMGLKRTIALTLLHLLHDEFKERVKCAGMLGGVLTAVLLISGPEQVRLTVKLLFNWPRWKACTLIELVFSRQVLLRPSTYAIGKIRPGEPMDPFGARIMFCELFLLRQKAWK